MERKKILIIFLLVSVVQTLTAQDFPFRREVKKPLGTEDFAYLAGMIKDSYDPQVNFSYNIEVNDINPGKLNLTPDKPTSFAQVDQLRKNIDTCTRAVDKAWLYLGMGQALKRLNRPTAAYENFNKAYEVLLPETYTHENDSQVLITAASIKMAQGEYKDAYTVFMRLKKINSNCDALASSFIPLLFLNMGMTGEASQFVDESLKKWPEGEVGLVFNLVVQVYAFNALAPQRLAHTTFERFNSLPPDSLFDLKRLYDLHKKYPDEIKWEQLYKGAQVMGMYTKKSAMAVYTDSGAMIIFSLSPVERELLTNLRDDFERIAKSRKNKNPYFAYKTLGSIEFLFKNFDKSIQWYRKAIKSRKPGESTFDINAGEAWDNIIGGYLMAGDTLKAQKELEERIKARPEINPRMQDYISLAKYNWYYSQPAEARKNYQQALTTDSLHWEHYEGLAACTMAEVKTDEVREHLDKALAINANSAQTYYLYGIYSLLKKDYNTAYTMLKTSWRAGKNEETVFEVMERFFEEDSF